MRKRMLVIATGAVVVAVLVGGGIAWATGTGDEHPLEGSDLARATAAVLRHTGGGEVTEAETGEGGAAYDVEVRLPDGRQIEVDLDASFHVIAQERDDDGPGETEQREQGDD
jgi:hypothetical protein